MVFQLAAKTAFRIAHFISSVPKLSPLPPSVYSPCFIAFLAFPFWNAFSLITFKSTDFSSVLPGPSQGAASFSGWWICFVYPWGSAWSFSLQPDTNNFPSPGLQEPLQDCSHSTSLPSSDCGWKTKWTFYIAFCAPYLSRVMNFNTILGNIDLVQLSSTGNFIRNYFISHIIKLLTCSMSKVSSLILQNW